MELFISDLDGTLLNSNGEISDNTAIILNRLISKGLNFTVATARTWASAEKILEKIELKFPVILMNGVLIYNPVVKKYEVVNRLENNLTEKIISGLRNFGLSAFMYTLRGENMMTYYERLANSPMEDFYRERREKYYKSFKRVEDFHNVSEDVIYFTLIDSRERLLPLFEDLKGDSRLEMTFYNDVYSDSLWYLEIFSAAASKEKGVKYLRERYGFEKITAFGDNTNDLPMFDGSDFTVAVSGANERVKEKSCLVIGSNDEDGVAKYLEEIYNE